MVEKYTELPLIIKYSERVGVRPTIGLRVKLASRGSGRWKSSGGFRSKFGLSATEAMRALQELKALGMADCLHLLHFHLGSQITNIRQVKGAVNEAARIYVDLARAGAGLRLLDVGGGLGIDYDGSQTDFESSVNYTLQEYANDVIYHVMNVCDEAQVPHPTIVTESGRAITAYHSVLVFNVVGVSGLGEEDMLPEVSPDAEQPLIDLQETYRSLSAKNLLESYHDAQQALDQALNLFSLGYLSLEQRCQAENLYWAILRKIQKQASEPGLLSRRSWKASTPCSPIPISATSRCSRACRTVGRSSSSSRSCRSTAWTSSRSRNAVLGDITCDSDGKVDQFIDRRDVKRTLPLHPFNGQDYYLGAFLLGAYQEILGDLHNLFGDTNAVHVRMGDTGEVILDSVIKGDTVREVLNYVQFNRTRW